MTECCGAVNDRRFSAVRAIDSCAYLLALAEYSPSMLHGEKTRTR